jgi:hypothetical protein
MSRVPPVLHLEWLAGVPSLLGFELIPLHRIHDAPQKLVSIFLPAFAEASGEAMQALPDLVGG